MDAPERQPDYCYDEEWEYTMLWDEVHDLMESHDLSEPQPVYTLFKGPTKWAVNVPIGAGDGDFEMQLFDSRDAALAAIQPKEPDQ